VVTWFELVVLEEILEVDDGDTLQLAMIKTNMIDKIDLNIFILKHLKIIIL
jgi:hypothetical protein